MALGEGAEGAEDTDEFASEAAFSVARVVEYHAFAVRPRAVRLPRIIQRTGDVIAAVDEHGRDVGQAAYVGRIYSSLRKQPLPSNA